MSATDLLRLYHAAAQSVPGVLVLTPIVEGKKPRSQKFAIGDVEGMAAEATARGEHANVYFQPAVLRKDLPAGKRGGSDDIVAQIGLVIDDDPDTGKSAVLPPIEPTFVVQTCNKPTVNRHIHFVFSRPLPPAEAKSLAGLLHRKCGGDAGTGDIAHVWRIPDTLNIPTATKIKRGRPQEPQPVTLTEDGTLRPVDPDELRRVLEAMPDIEPARSKPNGKDHSHRSREELLASLPGDIVDMIETEGEDRSEHSFATMAALFERGLSDFDVISISDGAPFARKFWTRGDIVDEVTRARGNWERKREKSAKTPQFDWRSDLITADALEVAEFPPVSWIVDGLIPEGLTLLAGKPKIGKSWWALDLAIAVAAAGWFMCGIQPAAGAVLYCAMEDNRRRLKRRMKKLMDKGWPPRLTLTTRWRRLDQGGIADLRAWCESVASPRLIILDTLAGVRPVRTKDGYTEDYSALEELHRLANDLGIAIVVLHHTRKMAAEDPIDEISGTLGLAGAADTVMVLNRTNTGATLYGRGRDVEEFEHAVQFSKESARWRILGDAEEVRRSDTAKAILEALGKSKGPMGPKDIAAAADKNYDLVRQTLIRMATKGEVTNLSHGKYELPEKAET